MTNKVQNDYPAHNYYNCIDTYKEPDGDWSECPQCGLKPKVWVFDNGRHTHCGCWNSMYDQFNVSAESIMSVYKRAYGKNITQYDSDGLRKNWNHWCSTGEHLFIAGNGLW